MMWTFIGKDTIELPQIALIDAERQRLLPIGEHKVIQTPYSARTLFLSELPLIDEHPSQRGIEGIAVLKMIGRREDVNAQLEMRL